MLVLNKTRKLLSTVLSPIFYSVEQVNIYYARTSLQHILNYPILRKSNSSKSINIFKYQTRHKRSYSSRTSHCSFFIISSAFTGGTFKVYSWLGVRSFSFTTSLSLFTEQ